MSQRAANESADDANRTPSKKLTREKREETSPCWDMSQERVFIETVCNQRFNFFLVFFGSSTIGVLNARTTVTQQLILVVSICISFLLALKLNGTFRRLEAVIRFIRTDPSHPETLITDELAGAHVIYRNHPVTRRIYRHVSTIMDWPGMFAIYQFWIPVGCLVLQVAYMVALLAGWKAE